MSEEFGEAPGLEAVEDRAFVNEVRGEEAEERATDFPEWDVEQNTEFPDPCVEGCVGVVVGLEIHPLLDKLEAEESFPAPGVSFKPKCSCLLILALKRE
jgi:hypothetical protein